MTTAVAIDGALCSAEGAVVPVADRGFLYGDAAFETLRTYGGRVFALEEHLGRLQRAAALLGIPFPVSVGRFRGEIDAVLAAAANPESRVRVIVTRGDHDEGTTPLPGTVTRRIVMATPLPSPEAQLYRRGLNVVTASDTATTFSLAGQSLKTTSYLPNIALLRLARQSGADDAIALDSSGRVLDATSSTVFAWVGARWVTPTPIAGVLQGVTREHLIDVAAALGHRVEVRAMRFDDLLMADEVFLASTVRELAPVVRIDEHTVGEGAPGDRTRALHRAFRAHVGARGPMPWE